jgi:hypothetical protein
LKFFTRKRCSLLFAGAGLALMGIDLILTRDFFTHIGELMAASLLCFAAAIYLDRSPRAKDPSRSQDAPQESQDPD